jgi:hypothetical protein
MAPARLCPIAAAAEGSMMLARCAPGLARSHGGGALALVIGSLVAGAACDQVVGVGTGGTGGTATAGTTGSASGSATTSSGGTTGTGGASSTGSSGSTTGTGGSATTSSSGGGGASSSSTASSSSSSGAGTGLDGSACQTGADCISETCTSGVCVQFVSACPAPVGVADDCIPVDTYVGVARYAP